MITASLGAEPFARDAVQQLAGQVRMPPGRSAASGQDGTLLWVAPRGSLGQHEAGQWQVLLTGQLHNWRALADELDVPEPNPSAVYAAALARWGDRADEHCIGHYAAIAVPPDCSCLRLARSPFVAPPLHFRQDGQTATVAQQPRVLFWREAQRPAPDLERVAQTLVNDASDRFRSWYRGAQRVPLGTAVTLSPNDWDEAWRYDLFARPQVQLPTPQAYVEAALALLDEGIAAALEGAERPAIMLSGGLDSPLVAARMLRQLPPEQLLNGYTFGPDPKWQAAAPPGILVDDMPLVRAFAEQHPRLRPHFDSNPGQDFRSGLRDLIEASDAAPAMTGLAWIEHRLHRAARADGCDAMFTATWGNFGFSSRGPWAFSEFLRTGRWSALRKALRSRSGDARPRWRQFLSLAAAPLLPRGLWDAGQRLFNPARHRWHAVAIRPDWPELEQSLHRSRQAGYDFERLHPASKRAHWRALLAEDGQEQDQYALGMELLHGLPRRDPTAYRPLVEFCWGCPTDLFLRGETDRWLAREMARGAMPEAQRLNRDYGHHFTDWQPRLRAARAELREELARMADDPDIAAVIDLPRLQALVEQLPNHEPGYDPLGAIPYQSTLPIGMATARFIAYAKGRNDI